MYSNNNNNHNSWCNDILRLRKYDNNIVYNTFIVHTYLSAILCDLRIILIIIIIFVPIEGWQWGKEKQKVETHIIIILAQF